MGKKCKIEYKELSKSTRGVVCFHPFVELCPPSPAIQSLNIEGTQDSLSFPIFSTSNDVHTPLEPTIQIQDPSDLIKIIQCRENNKVLKRHISEMSE
jgi:hypothetical protein